MNHGALSLSVRLRHPSISPDAITTAMGVEPIAAHAVGHPRRTPAGKRLEGVYTETYWACDLCERTDAELADALTYANEWLINREAFVSGIVKSGGTVEYYVSISSKDRIALELTPQLLANCAQLGLLVGVEIFHD
jgi:hypothetical protein